MKRRRQKDPVLVGRPRGKGTPITITIEADLLKLLDVYRSSVEHQIGVLLPRAQVLEGLVNKVMRSKIEEAIALAAGRVYED